MKLTPKELAMVLAALRMAQTSTDLGGINAMPQMQDIQTEATPEDIDALCERLNFDEDTEAVKTLRQTIAAATLEPDLDKALVPIQATLGQDDGGPAGVFFSGNNGETWPTLTPEERHEVLLDYIASELTYIGLGDGA